jgi:acyl transferase domain-containing protein
MTISKHIHLIGICGTAMASLAGMLQAQGHRVTGSDTGAYPPMSDQLASMNIAVEPYSEENLAPQPDLVIVGNAISRGNVELEHVLNWHIPFTSMAAILGLDDEVVERICRRILNVWPANYNCPGQIVVSGENPAVDEACAAAEEAGARRAVKLRVSGAFHSPLVARAADRLRPALEMAKFAEPTSPFMSTVTARIESAKRMAPLLVEQLTAPVRFTHAGQALIREGVQTFVEVGPGNVLSGLIKRIDRSVKTISVSTPEEVDRLEETLLSA